MAAASGSPAVVQETVQFPVVGGGGGEAPRQWYVDERDGFISWLRGEFAAANAIIDLLINHLRVAGEPGEYDHVAGCIHQRRFHWTPILHLQQYFPVADVNYALQQVEWRQRQQTPQRHSYRRKEKDGRKYGFGHTYGHRSDGVQESHGSPASDVAVSDVSNVEKQGCNMDAYKDANQKSDAQMSQAKDSLAQAEKDDSSEISRLVSLANEMRTAGHRVGSDHRGDYNGSLKLSVNAGCLLVMQGKSADLAKRAIPSLSKQRILVTFGKSRLKKTLPSEASFFPSSAVYPASGPSSARPPNPSRHPSGRKNYGVIPTTCVLQAPSIHPQSMPPNGVQPLFVAAAPVVASSAMPYPAAAAPTMTPPATAGWTVTAPPRHPSPRLPVPGTGVFLPPGSVHLPPSQQLQMVPVPAESSYAPPQTFALPESNGMEKPNCDSYASPKNVKDSTGPSLKTKNTGNAATNKEQQSAVAEMPVNSLTEIVAK
ncbi:hypothetical protein BHE74_00049284 [Ensete ventricosum]|nr:hypothetical protein BHE74_00049284 [Ensete ventricosum]